MEKAEIYLDTNIVADAIGPLRKGHETVIDILKKCIMNDWDICISEDILTTLYYISKDKVSTLQFIQNIILKDWHVFVFGKSVIQHAIALSLEITWTWKIFYNVFVQKRITVKCLSPMTRIFITVVLTSTQQNHF